MRIALEPQAGSQLLFVTCPFGEILYEGTRGPGKTLALLMKFLMYVGQGYGPAWRGILFRQTFPQLEDVVVKSKQWFRQIFPQAKWNATDYKWVFPDGEEFLLRYMKTVDDYWNYHGHEYPFIAWEELTNWSNLECYNMMKACNRSSFPDIPIFYVATANPFGVGHGAVKQYFIDPAPALTPIYNERGEVRIRIHGDIRENQVLLKSQPEYINTLESITDENLRKAWLEGSWDIVAGGIFSGLWVPSRQVLEPFDIPLTWRIDRAFDWGSSKPFAVGWFAEADGCEVEIALGIKRSFAPRSLFLIYEWYGGREDKDNIGLEMLAKDIAAGIRERETIWFPDRKVMSGPADNAIFDTVNGMCIADDMAKTPNCISWTRSDKSPGSRVNGWELMRGMLAAAVKYPMEDPGLFVFNRCRHWIRTVPTLPRDSIKMDDVDTDANDHMGDMTRYRVTMPKVEVSQEEIFF